MCSQNDKEFEKLHADWSYKIKLDGYRAQAVCQASSTQLLPAMVKTWASAFLTVVTEAKEFHKGRFARRPDAAFAMLPNCSQMVWYVNEDCSIWQRMRKAEVRMASGKKRSFEPRTSFRFVAYRTLKRTLGELNAAVELIELAIRDFKKQAGDQPDPAAFIKRASAAHDVRVDVSDFGLATLHAHHFFIVSVHQQFEEFLMRFKKEHPQTSWLKDEENSLLKNVLSSFHGLSFNEMCEAIGRFEIDLADFYRNIRNNVVHSRIKMSAQGAARLRAKTQSEFSPHGSLCAPNDLEEICFDDFILYSRVVKHIALALCTVARPSDSEIADMCLSVGSAGDTGFDLTTLRAKKRRPESLRSALETLLRIKYGLSTTEAQPIVDLLLLKGPQALR